LAELILDWKLGVERKEFMHDIVKAMAVGYGKLWQATVLPVESFSRIYSLRPATSHMQ
jgi:hypothetical protein